MSDQCIICKSDINLVDRHSYSVLTEAGTSSINNASESRLDSLVVKGGEKVHRKCRTKYVNTRSCAAEKKRKISGEPMDGENVKVSLRSDESYDYSANCLFCNNKVTERQKLEKTAHQVMSRFQEFDQSIMEICEKREDELSTLVKGRISFVNDLHSEDTVYHDRCSQYFRLGKPLPKQFAMSPPVFSQKGRPVDQSKDKIFEEIVSYLEENEDDQITVSELVSMMEQKVCDPDKAYTTKWMKTKLERRFKNEITFTEINGKPDVITFCKKAKEILLEFFESKKSEDILEEKSRFMRTAANLIKNEIKGHTFLTTEYPLSEDIESVQTGKNFVTGLLQYFLEMLISKSNSDILVASLGQAIMQAVRPRGLLSPLQIGLGVQMHRQFGSRFMIDTLNKMGFCSSYSEVQKYERSAAVNQGSDLRVENASFVQHIADNVDHDLRTLNGLGTFHGMGILVAVTPKTNGTVKAIPRITSDSKEILEVGNIERHFFTVNKKNTLKFKELNIDTSNDKAGIIDIFWQCSWLLKPRRSLWNGYMQMVSKGSHPGESGFQFMPMIDMKATDESCILSTMHFVVSQAKTYNFSPVLTFDQPLFWKATEIQMNEDDSSDIRNIFLRLGGLHTEMSFLGAIGELMTSSGLQNALETIYAEQTVPYMLNGKAISRAVRGNLITIGVLRALLLGKVYEDSLLFDDEDLDNVSFFKFEEESDLGQVSDLFEKSISGEVSIEELEKSELVQSISKKMSSYEIPSRTAKLWLQYIEMVSILCRFIKAERIGDYQLHQQSLREMLPFFAASGHHLYLKSLYVYLQSMSELPKSNPNLHQKFVQGYHVVRRSERFWGGLSTDLVIEQVLMRSIKAVGGMTHGRGMTDLQRALWIMSTPACADMNRAMQHFTGVVYENSEQHKEVTCARIEKDYEDAVTISRYLIERNPFSEENGELRSIHTGEIAKETVNADNAKAIGEEIISGMNGHEIADYTFRKKNKAKIMNFSKSTVAIDNEVIAVDPQLLFQRLIAAIQFGGLEHDPATIFSYELSTFPLSMFDKEGMMRDPKPKSEIITEVKKHTTANNAQLPDQVKYVIDGGYLLHKIIWEKGATYNEICNTYIRYIQRHYGNHATIVFDGYDDNPSTKDSTHIRRSQGKVGKSVAVAGNVVFNMKKDDFLLNIQNKQAFLDLLGKKLINSNTSCLQASGDADFLIVQTAVISAKYSPTVVIGEDTDLIVLLLHHANIDDHKIYFTAEKTRRKKEHDVWCVTEAKVELGHDLCSSLLLLHAILGCDTTSRLFNIGKGKAVTCFLKDSNFRKNAINFTNEASITDDVVEVGKKMLLKLYGAKKELTLDELRGNKFYQKLSTSTKFIEPQYLCPTSESASHHILRVFHQVQTWKGNIVDPLDWGWHLRDGKMMPVRTRKEPAPSNLLKIIRCGCKTDCSKRTCTCVKYNLKCSKMCVECHGMYCLNHNYMLQPADDVESS